MGHNQQMKKTLLAPSLLFLIGSSLFLTIAISTWDVADANAIYTKDSNRTNMDFGAAGLLGTVTNMFGAGGRYVQCAFRCFTTTNCKAFAMVTSGTNSTCKLGTNTTSTAAATGGEIFMN